MTWELSRQCRVSRYETASRSRLASAWICNSHRGVKHGSCYLFNQLPGWVVRFGSRAANYCCWESITDGTGWMGLVTPEELAHVARPQTRRPVAAADQRWKREECAYVKHDKLFSDWKVRDVESSLSLSLSLSSFFLRFYPRNPLLLVAGFSYAKCSHSFENLQL
jgi:hypothetical protein